MYVPDKNCPIYCPKCKEIGRPNILLFNDDEYIDNLESTARYAVWEAAVERVNNK